MTTHLFKRNLFIYLFLYKIIIHLGKFCSMKNCWRLIINYILNFEHLKSCISGRDLLFLRGEDKGLGVRSYVRKAMGEEEGAAIKL